MLTLILRQVKENGDPHPLLATNDPEIVGEFVRLLVDRLQAASEPVELEWFFNEEVNSEE